MLVLRKLENKDYEAFIKGKENFKEMEDSWYSFIWKDGMNFEDLLRIQQEGEEGRNLPEGHVPSLMLYAFLDGEIVGRSSIRFELNDFLLSYGGHIGYAVAPKFRNRGIATEILKESLMFCKNKLGIKKVLVTCDDDNLGSIRTIEKNNGVLENKIKNIGKDVLTRRYWINID